MKKMWAVLELGWEYNDNYYERHERGGYEKPMKLFTTEDGAALECYKLNKVKKDEQKNGYEMTDEDNRPITEFYEVAEIEVVE